MAAVAFTPVSGSVAFFDGNVMNFATAGGYCTSYRVGGPLNDIRPVYAPGELGAGTQNFGGGAQTIRLEMVYVSGTEIGCTALFEADTFNLAAGTFSMSIDGNPFAGCILAAEPESEQPKSCGVTAKFWMKANLIIKCLRPF